MAGFHAIADVHIAFLDIPAGARQHRRFGYRFNIGRENQRSGVAGLFDADYGYLGQFLAGAGGLGRQGSLVACVREVALQEPDNDEDHQDEREQPQSAARGRGRSESGVRRVLLLGQFTFQIFDFSAQPRFGIFGHLRSLTFAGIVFHC